MFSPELRAAYREAWAQPRAITCGLHYYRNLRALRAAAREPPSWRIAVPTLVLWGERDAALRSTNLNGLEDFVPQLVVKRHATATHWVVHEEPAWVNDAIREVLSVSFKPAE
jgi:pimeloyl-ACP methyl ester carboxylesterase